MSEFTIEFVILGADVVQGVPTLSDPTATYGCRNADTREIVVLDDTPMDEGALLWSYDVIDTGGDANTVYRYYIETTCDSRLYYITRTTNYVQSACLVLGRYTTTYDIENRYGAEELARWMGSSYAEEPVAYATRLQAHIEAAEDWLDDELRGVLTIDVDAVPSKIKDLACDVAAVRIYESKGTVDINTTTGYPEHRLAFVQKRIKVELDKIRSGTIRLATDLRTRDIGVITD